MELPFRLFIVGAMVVSFPNLVESCGEMNRLGVEDKNTVKNSWEIVRQYGLPRAGSELLLDFFNAFPNYRDYFPNIATMDDIHLNGYYIMSVVDKMVNSLSNGYILAYLRTAGFKIGQAEIPTSIIKDMGDVFEHNFVKQIIVSANPNDLKVLNAWNNFIMIAKHLLTQGLQAYHFQENYYKKQIAHNDVTKKFY